ncbi:17376_t:CDS:2 [Funneliformis caledonium]|uniref:Small RNA 2'-O-methyltransferase n=1 Tax=Funneliformis caledonium TaxID=1117310 RepID=A0A9N9FUE4_9GLOM|nr:17376_t:CDS:2 [Funneliformis caledonium]
MEAGEDNNLVLFDPPLWRQRRRFVVETLQNNEITSVFDFGCGEGALLSFLIQPSEKAPITQLAGVDISHETLKTTVMDCSPWRYDHEFLRLTPLTVDIYQGSIDVADQRLLGFDALICMEVIEHVDPPVLNKFFDIVFGTYKPKIVIISTPNVEFNVYFPQLKYGTPEATLRIEDHRFEWTRREFQEWANSGAEKYNYSVEFTGVGTIKDGDPAIGTATQIAIFRDLNPSSKPLFATFGEYNLVKTIEFPYYNEPEKSTEEILSRLHYYLQFLCNRVLDGYTNDDADDKRTRREKFESNRIRVEEIWDIHEMRQLCQTQNKLLDVLRSSPDFTLMNNNEEMIVHREYPLNTKVNDDEDPNWDTTPVATNEWQISNNGWNCEDSEEDKGWG